MSGPVLFRADASVRIGTGHVMRCLTLADALARRGIASVFACARGSGEMTQAVRERGHDFVLIETTSEVRDAEVTSQIVAERDAVQVVVDHYELGVAWESAMPVPVMAIDDLRRVHNCDLLLDQNLGVEACDYAKHLPEGCHVLAGPGYALLRPEFVARRASALAARRGRPVRRLLVSMGGTDPDNATGWALRALARGGLPEGARVTVVLGPAAPHLDALRALLPTLPYPADLLVGTDRMADLMAEADICVGAAGSTSWERCCLGLPSVTVSIADNQDGIAAALDSRGAAIAVASGDDADLAAAIARLQDPNARAAMTEAAAAICDGGGAARVADRVLKTERSTAVCRSLRVSVVVDPPGGWFDAHASTLVGSLVDSGHSATLVHRQADVPEGDVAYYLSCVGITPPERLARNRLNVVVHASALPEGRGFSPLVWQVLEGQDQIPLSMIVMTAEVDAGDILMQRNLHLEGHELNDEMRDAMGRAIVAMCLEHMAAGAPTSGRAQVGEGSWYRRRSAKDSRLDPSTPLATQFDLLRVVDNERYPAFFDYRGHRYVLRIEKAAPQTDRPNGS